jgi:hypothetical protein
MLATGHAVHLFAFNANLENAQNLWRTAPKASNTASSRALFLA